MTDLSYRTASRRKKISRPVRWLRDRGLIVGRMLDYGCGKGYDALAFGAEFYDPHFQPNKPTGPFDTIWCCYVLNVIESELTRVGVLRDLQALLDHNGTAYISVRNVLSGKTVKGTWQGLIRIPGLTFTDQTGYRLYRLYRGSIITDCPHYLKDADVPHDFEIVDSNF